MLQHYLLFFTTRFNALSLISMTHQHRPLQVCKGQTHREQLFFRAGLKMRTMTEGHGQKGMGIRLVFYFPSKETNHLAWKISPGLVRRAVPLC